MPDPQTELREALLSIRDAARGDLQISDASPAGILAAILQTANRVLDDQSSRTEPRPRPLFALAFFQEGIYQRSEVKEIRVLCQARPEEAFSWIPSPGMCDEGGQLRFLKTNAVLVPLAALREAVERIRTVAKRIDGEGDFPFGASILREAANQIEPEEGRSGTSYEIFSHSQRTQEGGR